MKSFSGLTKEELYKSGNSSPCCDSAEYAGMLLFGSGISHKAIKFVTESSDVIDRYAALCRNLGFEPEIKRSADGAARYTAQITEAARIITVLNDYELIDPVTGLIKRRIAESVTERDCCLRAFIKGAFMGGGTVIDPNKNYNLEIVTPYMGLSREFSDILKRAGFEFRTVVRKSKYVLYIKNSETILDFLTYIGAYKAQMELINIKIEKEIRNDFNRSSNSETANIDKTINAAIRQIQAIELIDEKIGLSELPDELRELAALRLKNKAMSLSELGGLLVPPLGKSGVNHRFQKIIALAERLSDAEN